MLTPDDIDHLATQLEQAGYKRNLAAYIGDTPMYDQDGNIIVINEAGELIATIPGSVLEL